MGDGKHTKGPWRAVAPKGRPSDYTSIVEGPDGIMVLFAGSPARTDEEIAGNAVLAAAAPDLVEALKAAHKRLRNGTEMDQAFAAEFIAPALSKVGV